MGIVAATSAMDAGMATGWTCASSTPAGATPDTGERQTMAAPTAITQPAATAADVVQPRWETSARRQRTPARKGTTLVAAAASVRNDAASITDMSLRDKVTALADRLDMVGRGNPRAPDGLPDKNYMGGYQGMTPLVQQLKVACPNIGNDPLPAGFPSPPTK